MTAKKNSVETGGRREAKHDAAMAKRETRAVKDLALGDIIRVDGLEDDQVVRTAKRIRTGLDAGLVHVTLVARDGDRERIALAPEERVTLVGKAPPTAKGHGGHPGKTKAKAQA